jgi:hypothetical protein
MAFEQALIPADLPRTIPLSPKNHTHGDSRNERTVVTKAHGRWRNETGEEAAVGPRKG